MACLLTAREAAAGETVLRDDWNVVHMAGARVGWEHTLVKRIAETGHVSTTVESRISMLMMSETRELESRETTVETGSGALVSIHAVDKQSAEETTTDITFEGEKARMSTSAMGKKRETEVPVPGDLIGPWRAASLPLEAGFPVGRSFPFKTFMRQLGGVVAAVTKVETEEALEVTPGMKVPTMRLSQTVVGIPVEIVMWVEKDGTPRQSRIRISGMEIETRRATKEEALAGRDPKTTLPDMFTNSLILVETLFPHVRTADSARIRIRPKRPAVVLPDLSALGQTVEAREAGGAIVLSIKRRMPAEGTTGARPFVDPPPELLPYLRASSSIQSDDPLLVARAKEVVGEEADAWKASQAIERWVWKHLAKKNLGVGFASALEVCKNLEGDCTEHSVLVAGLCRAAGIPARVVMGLLCLQGIWGATPGTRSSSAGSGMRSTPRSGTARSTRSTSSWLERRSRTSRSARS